MHPEWKHIMKPCFERREDINHILSYSHWKTCAVYLIGFLKYNKKSKEHIELMLAKLYEWRMKATCPAGFVKECINKYYDRIWFNSSFRGQILKVLK